MTDSNITSHLFYSYIPRRTKTLFDKIKFRLEYKKYFLGFDVKEMTDTMFECEEFKKTFCQVTDDVVDVGNNQILMIQYQRPDGKADKRYAFIDVSDVKSSELKYKFKSVIDTGYPTYCRYQMGSYEPTEVFATSKFIHIAKNSNYSSMTRVELTDSHTRNTRKQGDNNLKMYPNEDFRFPTQVSLTPDAVFFITEESRLLVAFKLSDLKLIILAHEAQVYEVDHYGTIYFTKNQDGTALYKLDIRVLVQDKKYHLFHSRCEIKYQSPKLKGMSEDQKWLGLDIIKSDNRMTVMAAWNEFRRCNEVYFVQPGIFSHTKSIPVTKHISLYPHTSSTTFVGCRIEKFHSFFSLIYLLEEHNLHIIYHLVDADKVGVLLMNKTVTRHKDDTATGLLRLHKDHLLIFGRGILKLFKITIQNIKC